MKKRIIEIVIIILIILNMLECYVDRQEYYGEMDVVSSRNRISNSGYIQEVIVVLNQSEVINCEVVAKEIIERCLQNDFKSVQFCYDEKGYPKGITATVFLTEADIENWKPVFEMSYTQDFDYQYNMKDNPEEFVLEIKDFN